MPTPLEPTRQQPARALGDDFAAMLRTWRLGGSDATAVVMGIINATPDSFSDGGLFASRDAAAALGRQLSDEGAAILDIGGESTRANADPVSAEEEARRVLPVVDALANGKALVSVDTTKASVADAALRAGAHILNDIRGLQGDPAMAEVVARHGAGLVVMHNPGLFGSSRPLEGDPIQACRAFFERSLEIALRSGISEDRVALDPGLGFGKSVEQNFELVARLPELSALGFPMLIGASRKSFIGKITGRDVHDRLAGTLAVNVAAALAGAAILRVHDVAAHLDAVRIAAAIRAGARSAGRLPV